MTDAPIPATAPCAGGVTILKASASLSGSDPVSVIEAAEPAIIVTEAGLATGARLVCVTDQMKGAVAVSATSLTVIVTEFAGAAPNATVPLILPVSASSTNPAGKPSAVYLSVSPS